VTENVLSYETDDEKVEAIKKWWKENGLSVVAGTVLGLGAISGWQLWIEHQQNVAEAAATAFEQVLTHAAADDAEAVAKAVTALKDDFSSSSYASLGDLIAAKTLYAAGNAAAAMTTLQEVIAAAPDPAFASIAALRLARIQVAEQQFDAAAATLAAHDHSPAFAGEFAAVRGDLAVGRGDTAGARVAYEMALAQGCGLAELVRLKRDNLPPASVVLD
jgi:predicted negative regulator of RcsB-dependent stress response